MSSEHCIPSEFKDENSRKDEMLCSRCQREMGRRAVSATDMRELLNVFKDLFRLTEPWEIQPGEDVEQLRKRSEKYRMTAPEVVPIFSRRPF